MKLPKKVEGVLNKIDRAGFEVAIVGGAVRDFLKGEQTRDWDIATKAQPEEILKLFDDAFYNNIYGTVGIPVSGNIDSIQITTYRKEGAYSDMRHPDKVIWGKSLEEDLSRRDFTINAMALRFAGGKLLKLVDPFGGKKDFNAKLIKTVGDPDERFNEDALRLLRAVRFATTLNFEIENKTKGAIKNNAGLIVKISGERIRDELFKIIASKNAASGFFLLREVGLLEKILPELDVCFNVEQKSPKRHHIFDVGTHCVKGLEACPSDDVLTRFATLLHDIGKAKVAKVTEDGVRTFYNHEVVGGKQVKGIADRLHLSREQKDKLYKLVRYHQFSVSEDQTDKALRRFIKNIGIENIEDMMALRIGDRLGGGLQQAESWRLKLFRQRLKEVLKKPFTVVDIKINGRDVMDALGIGPGPAVGEVLNKVFEEVVRDKVKNEKEYLLKRLEKLKLKT